MNNKYNNIIKYLNKNVMDKPNFYWKYDIENGIFSRLQNDKYISKDNYEYINKMREQLWLKYVLIKIFNLE